MKTSDPYGGYMSIDPTVNPAYMQLPPPPEETPIPYSPEGWERSRLMKGTGKVEEKKAGGVDFTPEQMALLGKLTSVPGAEPLRSAPGAPSAIKNQVGPMQQLTLQEGGKQATAPRASLGQIIYGGRKF